MTKRLINMSSNFLTPKSSSAVFHRNLNNKIPTKEIQIPVKYGHLAGKLWGSGEGRPILALHGWQDNAGTWDPLIPMIIKDRPILAIDFPGHGLSSWIPNGTLYHQWEWPRVVLYLKEYFKWDKVSILSHSMGSICGMRFATVFPDDVDFYIAIDSLVYDDYDLRININNYPKIIQQGLLAQDRLDEEPPAYTLEEMTKLWHLGTTQSIALDSVQHLLKRGAKQSKTDPTKYYFSRDARLKHLIFNPDDKTFMENLIKRLKCPTLYLKAKDSPYSADEFTNHVHEILQKQLHDKYEFHLVPGKHHVQLNNPEIVAPLIKKFLEKHNLSI